MLAATERDLLPETSGWPVPKQVWTVAVSARSTGLEEGVARATAHVEGISAWGGGVASVDVPVLLRIASPLTSVPSSIYLNNRNLDEGQRVRVFVHRDELKPADDAEIRLSHNFGKDVIAHVVEAHDGLIVVDARMAGSSKIHASTGTLTFSMSRGNAAASLSIPLVITRPSATGD